MMFLVVFVLGGIILLVVLLSSVAFRSVRRPAPPVERGGHWETHHHDVKGVTRVVVRKVSTHGTNILDEHEVATIPVEAEDYDARFLTAMATARERVALFESEQD